MPPKVTLFAPTPDAFEDQGAPTFKYVLLAMLVTVCLSPLIPITEPRLNCVVNEVPPLTLKTAPLLVITKVLLMELTRMPNHWYD